MASSYRELVTRTDVIMYILSNCTEEYDSVIQSLQKEISAGETLTLKEVRTSANDRWTVLCDRKKKQGDYKKNDNVALVAMQQLCNSLGEKGFAAFVKQFKNYCIQCGKYGHKWTNFPDCKKPAGDDSNNGGWNNK